jgi:hypothetical protein
MEPIRKSTTLAYSCICFVGANNKFGRLKEKQVIFLFVVLVSH